MGSESGILLPQFKTPAAHDDATHLWSAVGRRPSIPKGCEHDTALDLGIKSKISKRVLNIVK